MQSRTWFSGAIVWLIGAIVWLVLMLAGPVPSAAVESPEAQANDVLKAYIDATRTADSRLARSLFHPEARMAGETDGRVQAGSPEPFFKALDKIAGLSGANEHYSARIAAISVLSEIATGTVIEKNLMGYDFTTHFHLVKTEGRWLIVSKLYRGAAVEKR